jgi:cell division protein ZapA
MCSDKNVLKVKIYGAEYSITSHEDMNCIKEVAEYVDEKMREVDVTGRVDSSLKIAILASVNIAGELFHLKKEMDQLRKQLEDKIRQLNKVIDQKVSKYSDS